MFHGTSTAQTVPQKEEHILIEINLSKGCILLRVKVMSS